MQNYYLGQWEWKQGNGDGFWEAPYIDQIVGTLDLRSTLHCALRGNTPFGYGIFTYLNPINDPNLIFLGFGKDDVVPSDAKKFIKKNTGKDILANDVKGMIFEFLSTHSDETGLSAVKPLMPTDKMRIEIYVGVEGKIMSDVFTKDNPHWNKVKACLQNDYLDYLKSTPQNSISKWLDLNSKKFNTDYTDFIPANAAIKLTPLPHETVITESFNKADGALGPDLSWTVTSGTMAVASNQLACSNSATTSPWGCARADSNLSSSDHYSQASVTALGAAGDRQIGVCVRYDSASTSGANTTFYATTYNAFSLPSRRLRIGKCVNGTVTNLVGPDTSTTSSLPETLRLEVSGSNLTCKVAGSTVISTTDSAISGNLRCGFGNAYNLSTNPTADSFEAGDLVSTTTVNVPAQSLSVSVIAPVKAISILPAAQAVSSVLVAPVKAVIALAPALAATAALQGITKSVSALPSPLTLTFVLVAPVVAGSSTTTVQVPAQTVSVALVAPVKEIKTIAPAQPIQSVLVAPSVSSGSSATFNVSAFSMTASLPGLTPANILAPNALAMAMALVTPTKEVARPANAQTMASVLGGCTPTVIATPSAFLLNFVLNNPSPAFDRTVLISPLTMLFTLGAATPTQVYKVVRIFTHNKQPKLVNKINAIRRITKNNARKNQTHSGML